MRILSAKLGNFCALLTYQSIDASTDVATFIERRAGTEETIRIGTSGWSYAHWKGPFYPESLKPADFLSYYCRYFSTLELQHMIQSPAV